MINKKEDEKYVNKLIDMQKSINYDIIVLFTYLWFLVQSIKSNRNV